MAPNDGLLVELAGAILDGTEIDWASADSSAGLAERPLLRELRLLAAVAEVHRDFPNSGDASLPGAKHSGDELKQWGALRVLERIGRGAFGQVYRAWDTRLDREVALKLMPANSREDGPRRTSIIQEGRLLARVRHPNVVTIYGAERIEDRIGIWMEFVKGRTLEQVLQQRGALSAAEATDIGIELCRAVSAVHAAGLLHRDIKAHNVMLTDEGRVVLMDFGTGRERDGGSAEIVAGTPLYLAPELICRKDASVRSDIYSIGVLLYHLLTGSYPVLARSLRDLRAAHERQERTDVKAARPHLPVSLCRIIERAIDPEPASRYDTAAALQAALAALIPRPAIPRVVSITAVAIALLLVVWVAFDLRGRQITNPRATPLTITTRGEVAPTTEETKHFLRTARIISSVPVSGNTLRLTLTDGRLVHDAAFAVGGGADSSRPGGRNDDVTFVEPYRYNIAAFALAELLDIEEMVPVTVERTHLGSPGSLAWWIDVKRNERERVLENLQPPDVEAWNKQIHRARVFAQLIYNTERSYANVLITEDWQVRVVDFIRAFRPWQELTSESELRMCDRQLFARLRQLRRSEVEKRTQPYLSDEEIGAVMARRDLIIAHFERLIERESEADVLY